MAVPASKSALNSCLLLEISGGSPRRWPCGDQLTLEHLAGIVGRQRRADPPAGGNGEVRQILSSPSIQLGNRRPRTADDSDRRSDNLAEVGVRKSDHGNFGDIRM